MTQISDGLSNELAELNRNKQNILDKIPPVNDVNYIMDTGHYWIDKTVISNSPGNNYGVLEVSHTSAALQRFTTYPESKIVSRMFANNQWSDWRYPDGTLFS